MSRRLVATVAGLALTLVALAIWPHLPAGTPPQTGPALIATAWVGFALGAWLLMRLPVTTGSAARPRRRHCASTRGRLRATAQQR